MQLGLPQNAPFFSSNPRWRCAEIPDAEIIITQMSGDACDLPEGRKKWDFFEGPNPQQLGGLLYPIF